MARKPRQNVPGVHHVYARGNNRHAIFCADDDRSDYLLLLGRVVRKRRWRGLSYCLMDNHVHLLVEIEEPSLSAGIQWLHGLYGLTFNERYGRGGHVFQGRYGSKLVTTDEQLWWTAAYIAMNPVKSGLCAAAADWPWSSYAVALAGQAPRWLDEARLIASFRGLGGDPHERYTAFMAAAAFMGSDPLKGLGGQTP